MNPSREGISHILKRAAITTSQDLGNRRVLVLASCDEAGLAVTNDDKTSLKEACEILLAGFVGLVKLARERGIFEGEIPEDRTEIQHLIEVLRRMEEN